MVPSVSARRCGLSPSIEGTVAEETMVNCFEMVPADAEQVLDRTVN